MAVTNFANSSIKDGNKYKSFAYQNYLPFAASGGDEIVTISGTRYHVFSNSGNFVITGNESKSVSILVVGGGGGGGRSYGGGGGGGEIDLFAAQTLSAGSYTVTVGALGAGSTDNANKGASGGQSQFVGVSTITALGGGGAGSAGNNAGANGGSGGGGSGNNATGGNGKAGVVIVKYAV
jgi:hypothetical protein